MLIAGAAMSYFGAGACGWLVLALVAAIVAYDAFHKPWAGSVLIMGSCRTLLYLVAGSAVTGGLGWETNHELVIKAVALGGYIVGVSLTARGESAAAPRKAISIVGGFMLCLPFIAIVSTVMSFGGEWVLGIAVVCLGAWSLVMPSSKAKPEEPSGGCLQHAHWILPAFVLFDVIAMILGSEQIQEELMRAFVRASPALICAVILTWLVKRALNILRTPPPSNIGRAVGLLLAGIVVVDGLAISLVSPAASLLFAGSMPLLLLWQRKIAAT
jgi:4-hydroxybenzoate polyprenyltransferase